ncbi:response regulator transcription factor [Magnetococcus sp. PR-3]|uniref:response regulator transcription factor n=1 Tax=Magnetococcus sp. PR-3 TaxID=3120355 RepID=UPI002FCE34BA
MSKARVYLVEDDADFRQSLCWLLESIEVEAICCDGGDAFLEKWNPGEPSCIILDLRMPRMGGLELQKRIRDHDQNTTVIFLSGHGTLQTAVHAMKQGAADFFEKPLDEQRFLDRVQEVLLDLEARKQTVAGQSVLLKALEELTRREREIFELLLQGHTTKQMAESLNVSNRTVDTHRANILGKLEARSMVELISRYRDVPL